MRVCTFWLPFSNTPFSHSLHFEFNGSYELNKYCCVHNVKRFMYKNYGISTTLDKPVSFKTVVIKLTRKKKNQTILLTYYIFLTEVFCGYISMYVNTFWKIHIVSDFCSLPFVTCCIWVSWSKQKFTSLFLWVAWYSFVLGTPRFTESVLFGVLYVMYSCRQFKQCLREHIYIGTDSGMGFMGWSLLSWQILPLTFKRIFLAYAYTSSVWKLSLSWCQHWAF